MNEIEIPISQIAVARDADGRVYNPRGSQYTVPDLVSSFRAHGQQTPILVYELDEGEPRIQAEYDADAAARYVVVDEHRRLSAAHTLNWTHIKGVVTERPANLRAAMLACYVRKDPKALAIGHAFVTLHAEGMTYTQIALLTGMTPEAVGLYISLLNAPEKLQKAINDGTMSIWAWKALRDRPREIQEQIGELEQKDGKITVRRVREHVRRLMQNTDGDLGETQGEVNIRVNMGDAQAVAMQHVAALRMALYEARRTGDDALLAVLDTAIGNLYDIVESIVRDREAERSV